VSAATALKVLRTFSSSVVRRRHVDVCAIIELGRGAETLRFADHWGSFGDVQAQMDLGVQLAKAAKPRQAMSNHSRQMMHLGAVNLLENFDFCARLGLLERDQRHALVVPNPTQDFVKQRVFDLAIERQ
jgi:hypothetical protein